MDQQEKLLIKILSGTSDRNISFKDTCKLLLRFGFNVRIKGDHHIFAKTGIQEILNLQPDKSKAKPYQVKQVRNLIIKYKFAEI